MRNKSIINYLNTSIIVWERLEKKDIDKSKEDSARFCRTQIGCLKAVIKDLETGVYLQLQEYIEPEQ